MVSLGVLRVDELLLPIVEIRLINGGFLIVAELTGPCSECSGPVRLFTSEGFPVLDQVPGRSSTLHIPYVREHDTARVSYTLYVNEITSSKR